MRHLVHLALLSAMAGACVAGFGGLLLILLGAFGRVSWDLTSPGAFILVAAASCVTYGRRQLRQLHP